MRTHLGRLLGGRRRKATLGVTAAVAAAGVFAISALAVHDLAFELDGDVTTQGSASQPPTFDWDALFDASGDKNPLPAGFTASGFDRDFVANANGSFNSGDSSTYATGSKDTLPISGWQCSSSKNVGSKVDLMNAYAAAYTAPNGDQVIYFASERNGNNGDSNVGFWFLQDGVRCDGAAGTTTFTGAHRDGDLLVVSAFTNGGSIPGIDVYRWNGGATGSLGTTPVAHGVDCKTVSLANDSTCATVNSGTITTPWLTSNSTKTTGHALSAGEFFEGGVNLTANNLSGKCFNTFIGNSRSSQSLTATLFDFSVGVIGECTSTTVTTPLTGAGDPIPQGGLTVSTDPSDSAINVKDSALITVTGVQSFDATVSFHLCGPIATGTCDTGGVDIGTKPVTASGTIESDAATVSAAGRYCWRADFSGDASVGVPESSDHLASECFVVNPVKPMLSTEAGAGPVDFGSPINDTATLSGTAHKPGTGGAPGSTLAGSINATTPGGDATGTITFTLYDNATCAGTPVFTTTRAVSGDGTYGPVSFTPTAPGTYHWVASYPGDSPNTLAADTGACDDANEDVIVRQIPTEIKTKQSWYPNDTATISATIGDLAANGSVVFKLYDNATCTGTALHSETKSIGGGSPTETVSTNNTTFAITTGFADAAGAISGPYSWKITYTPAAGDTAHTGKQSSCDAEHFSITYTNDNGPGTNIP